MNMLSETPIVISIGTLLAVILMVYRGMETIKTDITKLIKSDVRRDVNDETKLIVAEFAKQINSELNKKMDTCLCNEMHKSMEFRFKMYDTHLLEISGKIDKIVEHLSKISNKEMMI